MTTRQTTVRHAHSCCICGVNNHVYCYKFEETQLPGSGWRCANRKACRGRVRAVVDAHQGGGGNPGIDSLVEWQPANNSAPPEPPVHPCGLCARSVVHDFPRWTGLGEPCPTCSRIVQQGSHEQDELADPR